MRISFVAPFGLKTKGTVSGRVLPLASALAERGHQVRVSIPPWDDAKPEPPIITRQEGVELVTLPLERPLVINLSRRLAQSALEFQPDVTHVIKPKGYSGLAGLYLALRGHRFVLDTDDWEGAGGWNDINPYSWSQKKLFSWQERDLPRRASAVTVASRTLQTQVWSFGVKPERVFYLPNGVSRSKYADWSGPTAEAAAQSWRQKLGLQDKLVLLVYTRFAEFQPERLLKIVKRTLELLPEDLAAKARLLVVGGGFFGEEKKLKQLAAPYGLADKIITTGQATWEDLPGLLRCGDVALYPFDDNLINRARCSLKFVELLVAERPVITEAVGQQSDYLREGEGGFLIPPGDEEIFAYAAARLLQLDPATRHALGKQGASRIWAEFDWSRLAGIAEAAYKFNF